MESIEKPAAIDRENLSEEFFLQALLESAYSLRMITTGDIDGIRLERFELMAEKAKRYAGCDSDSVRVEVARNIMSSINYSMGLFLKSFQTPDEAVKALKEMKMADILSEGRKRVDITLKTAKAIHSRLISEIISVGNICYNDTVFGGITGFFKLYDPDLGAHETHINADYPTCNPMKRFAGAEFIKKYTEAIYYENTFCRNFQPGDMRRLLYGYDRSYKDLIFNIYEIALTSALGSLLSGGDARRLIMTESAALYLDKFFRNQTDDRIDSTILEAYDGLKKIFDIKGSQELYIKASLKKISSEIKIAVKLDTVGKLFISPEYHGEKPVIYYSCGEKTDNESYRKIVEKIMQSENLSDKILIIKNQIHSLADLEDVLLDAEMLPHEITAVLRGLEPLETAALLKKYPLESDIETAGMRKSEMILTRCLNDLFSSMPEKLKEFIYKAVKTIEFDRSDF